MINVQLETQIAIQNSETAPVDGINTIVKLFTTLATGFSVNRIQLLLLVRFLFVLDCLFDHCQ